MLGLQHGHCNEAKPHVCQLCYVNNKAFWQRVCFSDLERCSFLAFPLLTAFLLCRLVGFQRLQTGLLSESWCCLLQAEQLLAAVHQNSNDKHGHLVSKPRVTTLMLQ